MRASWWSSLPVALASVVALSTTGHAAAAAAIRDCGAAQLAGEASFQGETGSEDGGIVVRNTGTATCLLPRWPRLAVLWSGRRLSLRESLIENYRPDSGQRRVGLLEPGQWAFAPIWWSNWCGARPWGTGFFTPVVRLTLDDSTTLSLGIRHPSRMPPPRCDSPGRPSPFQVGRFYTPPVGWKP